MNNRLTLRKRIRERQMKEAEAVSARTYVATVVGMDNVLVQTSVSSYTQFDKLLRLVGEDAQSPTLTRTSQQLREYPPPEALASTPDSWCLDSYGNFKLLENWSVIREGRVWDEKHHVYRWIEKSDKDEITDDNVQKHTGVDYSWWQQFVVQARTIKM